MVKVTVVSAALAAVAAGASKITLVATRAAPTDLIILFSLGGAVCPSTYNYRPTEQIWQVFYRIISKYP
jgi:hypothetical protein